MDTRIEFLYLSEPDMVKAGVKDMKQCVEVMEDLLVTLQKGDYVMGGRNHNSHGCMVTFPKCRRAQIYGDAGIPWRALPAGRYEMVWFKYGQ